VVNHLESCTTPESCWCEFRSYTKVLLLGVFILLLEIGGGIISNSLALLADAGHVATDLGALTTGLFVSYIVRRTKNEQFYRAGGWIVIGLLLVVAVWIFVEAIDRLWHLDTHEVQGGWMLIVAAIGAVLNRVQHQILHRLDSGHAMHRGLIVHVHSDYLQSIVVIIGAGIIVLGSWAGVDLRIVDSVLSFGIAIWIVWQAYLLINELNAGDHEHASSHHNHHHH